MGVQVVQRWVVAALRKRKFFSLAEVSQTIAGVVGAAQPAALPQTRSEVAPLCSQQLDQPALKPFALFVPQFGEWETARVNIDYHISGAALLSFRYAGASTGGCILPGRRWKCSMAACVSFACSVYQPGRRLR